MLFRVINDFHHRGVNPIGTFDDLIYSITSSPYKVILNGDIFDYANCPKKMLPTLYQETSVVLALLKKQGGVFIRGNHCLNLVPGPDYVIIDTVLFAHSHIESWGQERADKYMSQTPGAGWFKRNIISRPLDYLRRLLTVRPNKRLLEAVAAYKKQFPELTHMVFGHSHPEHNVYFEHMGVKGVITKRGVNDLVLDI